MTGYAVYILIVQLESSHDLSSTAFSYPLAGWGGLKRGHEQNLTHLADNQFLLLCQKTFALFLLFLTVRAAHSSLRVGIFSSDQLCQQHLCKSQHIYQQEAMEELEGKLLLFA